MVRYGQGKCCHVNHSTAVHFAIDILAVTLNFLFSLLFQVNCFYFNPCFLPFVPPILLPILPQATGMGE